MEPGGADELTEQEWTARIDAAIAAIQKSHVAAPESVCATCTRSRRKCRSCRKRRCAQHLSALNGCCSDCLKEIQEAHDDGRCTDGVDESAIRASGGDKAVIYGEMTPLGFSRLGRRLRLGSADCFADLGSGLGRVTAQAVREFGVRRACGVELAASRHQRAQEAIAVAPAEVASRVEYLQGDCADEALWSQALVDVTVVYTCNLLFGPGLMARVRARIESSAAVRVVAAFKPWDTGLNVR